MAAKPIPDGYRSVTPYLIVNDGNAAIDFYKKAFGAEEVMRMPGPDGQSVMHAELRIGDSVVMLAQEFPGAGCKAPKSLNGTTCNIHLYVEDCDAAYSKATGAGATATMPLMDAFWGDRYGKVTDPFGHEWSIATHKEDLTPEQIQKGAEEFFASMGSGGCQ
ncbi:MAG: VOC family protein [Phycisphaerales bacterium]|nr:VOC family protein [Phycisphaerales bacterium]